MWLCLFDWIVVRLNWGLLICVFGVFGVWDLVVRIWWIGLLILRVVLLFVLIIFRFEIGFVCVVILVRIFGWLLMRLRMFRCLVIVLLVCCWMVIWWFRFVCKIWRLMCVCFCMLCLWRMVSLLFCCLEVLSWICMKLFVIFGIMYWLVWCIVMNVV